MSKIYLNIHKLISGSGDIILLIKRIDYYQLMSSLHILIKRDIQGRNYSDPYPHICHWADMCR